MRVCQFRHFGEWTTLQQRHKAAEIRLNPEDRFLFYRRGSDFENAAGSVLRLTKNWGERR